MRVLFVAGYDDATYHRKIELLADAPDVEILHVNPKGCGREDGWYPSARGDRRYRLRTFRVRSLGRTGDPHRSYLWPPDLAMAEFQPDLIHAENDVETVAAVQVTLARWLWARRSKLIHYSWQNILRPRRWHVRRVTRLSLQAADHVVCASHEAAGVLRHQGFRRATSVLPTGGLDTRYFHPRRGPESKERLGLTGFVIGFVGRLAPEKGIDTLLAAAARMPAGANVLIVGNGPDKARLVARARVLGLEARCRWVENVPHEGVSDYMNAMDVLVLPSRTTTNWKEQFGRVLMEASGCRIAVVGSDSGAIPEVLGEEGRRFPEGDAGALAGILQQLAQDADLRERIAECGYRRALENYSVELVAERLLRIWRDLQCSMICR